MTDASELFLREFLEDDGLTPGRLSCVSDEAWTPKTCLQVVIHNGQALEYIPDRLKTQELCEIAVGMRVRGNSHLAQARQDPAYMTGLFNYIPIRHRTYELCMALVSDRSSGMSISAVPYQLRTLELCLKCLEIGEDDSILISIGTAQYYIAWFDCGLRHIPPEVQTSPQMIDIMKKVIDVGMSGRFLEYMYDQPIELLIHAIRKQPSNLRYCRRQTPEICMTALESMGIATDIAPVIKCIQKDIGSDEKISMYVAKHYPMYAYCLAGLTVDAFIQVLETVTHVKKWVANFGKQTREQSFVIWRYVDRPMPSIYNRPGRFTINLGHSDRLIPFEMIWVENRQYVVDRTMIDYVVSLLAVNLSILSIVEVCNEIMVAYTNTMLDYPAIPYWRLWVIVTYVREFV